MLWLAFAILGRAATDGASGPDQASNASVQDPAMSSGLPDSEELPSTMSFESGLDPLFATDEADPNMFASAFADPQLASLSSVFMTATASDVQSSVAEAINSVFEGLMNQQSKPTASLNKSSTALVSRITASSGPVQTGLTTDGSLFPPPVFANNTGNFTSALPNGRNNTVSSGSGPAATSTRTSSTSSRSSAPANGASVASLNKYVAIGSVLSTIAFFM